IQSGMSAQKPRTVFTRFPIISAGAEYLVMGYLMRRNILVYKAPPNNEGYDLICIHPDPRKVTRQIRVQVKSRLATESGGFPIKASTIDAFDFLIVAYLNVGYFLGKHRHHGVKAGTAEPYFLYVAGALHSGAPQCSKFVGKGHNARS
ncbi:hypothetical protein B2A_11333, partial [mine drainage metagenome]